MPTHELFAHESGKCNRIKELTIEIKKIKSKMEIIL